MPLCSPLFPLSLCLPLISAFIKIQAFLLMFILYISAVYWIKISEIEMKSNINWVLTALVWVTAICYHDTTINQMHMHPEGEPELLILGGEHNLSMRGHYHNACFSTPKGTEVISVTTLGQNLYLFNGRQIHSAARHLVMIKAHTFASMQALKVDVKGAQPLGTGCQLLLWWWKSCDERGGGLNVSFSLLAASKLF